MQAELLLEETLAIHGGRERWRQVEVIEAALSSGGLAFTAHCQPTALRGLQAAVEPHWRRVVFGNYCRPGGSGIWTPDHVQILDADGRMIAERRAPRAAFGRLVKNVRWDKLDILYFAGYALWNYLSFPFLLAEPGVALASVELPDGGFRLDARFDASIPTHSAVQSFHLDASKRLLRHDYTADVIGRWAKAANFCLAADSVEGLRFYTRRRVLPRAGGGVLPFPTLVWIEIDDLRVVGRGESSAAGAQ